MIKLNNLSLQKAEEYIQTVNSKNEAIIFENKAALISLNKFNSLMYFVEEIKELKKLIETELDKTGEKE
jgi:hypothetical protein